MANTRKEVKWLACPACGSKNLNLEIDGGPKKPGEICGGECLGCGRFFTLERGQADGKLYAEYDSSEPATKGAGSGNAGTSGYQWRHRRG